MVAVRVDLILFVLHVVVNGRWQITSKFLGMFWKVLKLYSATVETFC